MKKPEMNPEASARVESLAKHQEGLVVADLRTRRRPPEGALDRPGAARTMSDSVSPGAPEHGDMEEPNEAMLNQT